MSRNEFHLTAQLIQYQEANIDNSETPLRWQDIKKNENANSIDISNEDLINAEDLV